VPLFAWLQAIDLAVIPAPTKAKLRDDLAALTK
jgi:hypothetical protein